MNSYRIQIDMLLEKPVASHGIWMRHVRFLPFVPRAGDTIRLTCEDDESTLNITFQEVVYDVSTGTFHIDLSDNTLVTRYNEEELPNEKELIGQYTAFDFLRVNFPTVIGTKQTGA